MKLPAPTVRQIQSFDDVSAGLQYRDDVNPDTRQVTASTAGRLWSVYRRTRTPTIGDRSAVGRRDRDGVLNPLYVAVPATCACVLMSLTVLGVLLLRYGRVRRTDGRRKCAALLPSSSASSPPLCHPAVEFSRSYEPCICLHCNRANFESTSVA